MYQMSIINSYFLAEKEVAELNVKGATSSPFLNNDFPLIASLDNNDQTFYHSKHNQGWVKYEIAQAYVTLVRVQNRHDCCS